MIQVFIGACSGLFSGIGMGGGTILILLLTTISGIEQHIAQATNLIYFIPTAISAIIANYKNKIIDFKTEWFQRGTVHLSINSEYIKTGKSNFIVLITEFPVKFLEKTILMYSYSKASKNTKKM